LTLQLFDHLGKDDKKKVIPVVGELTENNFGFNDDVLEKLCNEVNIVFHSAATIKFNTHLATAIKINLVGTKVVIDFAKSLRNLVSFVHISTAFCNSCYLNQGIKEQVYASECDPYDMMKLIDGNNNMADKLYQTGTPELQAILKSHPNTYTFTKQMAENLILLEMKNYPVGICRPSVVYGTHKQPFPGWLGSANNGHIGFVAGFTKGLFRTMGGDESSIMDLIPVDYVTNSIITLAWYTGTRKIEEPEVIHCTSGEINPLSFGEYCKILNNASKKHPNDFIICQPRVKVRNGFRYTLFVYMFNFLPALIIWLPEHLLWRRKALRT
jgi:alcohol-forming fatty acyl-CoA reductase